MKRFIRNTYKRFEQELSLASDSNEDEGSISFSAGSDQEDAKSRIMNSSGTYTLDHSYNGDLENGTGSPNRSVNGGPQQEFFDLASSFFEYDPKEHEIEDELGFIDPSNPPVPGWNLKYLQWKTRRFVEHFAVRLLTALFIIVDMVILIVDLCNNPTEANDPLEYCSLAFSIYFVVEVLLRIFGLGPWHYFRKWYNILDFIIVMATFILSILMVALEDLDSNPANLLIVLRLIRLLRITRILWQRRHIQVGARQFISQNKRRYQRDGFDLDLTYISPRIIAMSFPSTGRMSMYRNDIREVARFLNTKHKSNYRIYNLCSERHYDSKHFHGKVMRYLIDDHNVPSLKEMLEFSETNRAWMSESEENVIAVHCKGGKGRTGTMICVVLIDTEVFTDADHCLGYFGDRRTDKNAGKKFQGVETPSQSRYVGYYEKVVKANREIPEEIPLIITAFTVRGIHSVGGGNGSEFSLSIRSRFHSTTYEASLQTNKNCSVMHHPDKDEIHIKLNNAPVVKGDTKVMFHSQSRGIPRGYENCPFYFWFHTGFIKDNRLELPRHELDNPHKSKTWSTFKNNFLVVVHFSPSSTSADED